MTTGPLAAKACAPALPRVRPAGGTVPANLLRLHLEFDVPSWIPHALAAVRLVGDEGPIEMPFLDLEEGLWDPDLRRLTLLLHPGRIKSGLLARAALGGALAPALPLWLQVELTAFTADAGSGWTTVASFDVVAAETRPLDMTAWTLDAPPAASNVPLTVWFDRTVDALALRHGLAVLDATDQPVPVAVLPADDGRSVALAPERPWDAGAHRLVVRDDFEDVAGNRIGVAFEHTACAGKAEAARSLAFVVAG